jgi:hypothetical protein
LKIQSLGRGTHVAENKVAIKASNGKVAYYIKGPKPASRKKNRANRTDGPIDVAKPAYGDKEPRKGLKAVKKDVIDFPEREEAVRDTWKNDQASAKDFGKALLYLKDAFYTHGAFTKWLRQNGIDQNRASYCMREALNKNKESQQRHKDLPQTKLKSSIDYLFRAASKKQLQVEVLETEVFRFAEALIVGVGKTAEWPMQRTTPQLKAAEEQLKSAVAAVCEAAFVVYELNDDGEIVNRATGRAYADLGSAVAAEEAKARAASAGH